MPILSPDETARIQNEVKAAMERVKKHVEEITKLRQFQKEQAENEEIYHENILASEKLADLFNQAAISTVRPICLLIDTKPPVLDGEEDNKKEDDTELSYTNEAIQLFLVEVERTGYEVEVDGNIYTFSVRV